MGDVANTVSASDGGTALLLLAKAACFQRRKQQERDPQLFSLPDLSGTRGRRQKRGLGDLKELNFGTAPGKVASLGPGVFAGIDSRGFPWKQ